MHEKGIGKDQNDRVGERVKDPVIVVEDDLVEQNEHLFPVHGDERRQNRRDSDGQNAGKQQISGILLFASVDDARSGKHTGHHAEDLKEIKNDLHLFKVDAPALAHGQGGEVQCFRAEDGVVPDEHIVILYDLLAAHTGIRGDVQQCSLP